MTASLKNILCLTGIGLLLNACSSFSVLSVTERIAQAQQIAAQHGWQSVLIKTEAFDLQAFAKPLATNRSDQVADTLQVYLEGDGHAWLNSQTPSDDPSPINPVALRLAVQDSSPAVAYLGRPCQYLQAETARNCSESNWTTHRFSPDVIRASSTAVDALKTRYQAKQVRLIGYSGGAAVALLVAAQRHDVEAVITVAGNLDTAQWTRHHQLMPLTGSLNPSDFSSQLTGIAQTHYVGGADSIMPPLNAQSYLARFPPAQKSRLIIMPAYAHVCCWAENWKLIYERKQGQNP